MVPLKRVSLAHFPVRSMEQLAIKTGLGTLNRLNTGGRSGHYSTLLSEITSGAAGFEAMAAATRFFPDTGRHSAEALKDTAVKFAPLPVSAPLAYGNCGLQPLSVLLKWIELHVIEDAPRTDPPRP